MVTKRSKEKLVEECPNCGSNRIEVLDSRFRYDGTRWRRRVCMDCNKRFSTIEVGIGYYKVLERIERRDVTIKKALCDLIEKLERMKTIWEQETK